MSDQVQMKRGIMCALSIAVRQARRAMRLPDASDYLKRSRDSQHNVPLTWLPSPMSTKPCVYQNRWNQSLSNCKKKKQKTTSLLGDFGTFFPLTSFQGLA